MRTASLGINLSFPLKTRGSFHGNIPTSFACLVRQEPLITKALEALLIRTVYELIPIVKWGGCSHDEIFSGNDEKSACNDSITKVRASSLPGRSIVNIKRKIDLHGILTGVTKLIERSDFKNFVERFCLYFVTYKCQFWQGSYIGPWECKKLFLLYCLYPQFFYDFFPSLLRSLWRK